MRRGPQNCRRRAGTILEAALVLPVFLTIVLGMIDVGIAVFRNNTLSQAARHGARQAIVHGKMAPAGWNGGPWGPPATYPGSNPYTVSAGSTSDPIASAVRAHLSGFDASTATITVQWLDGNNDEESRVRVSVSSSYQPMITFLFGNPTYTLSAMSTMHIAH
jgi:Flp pilus assembly protein TadG